MLSAVYGSCFIWFTLSRMLCGVSRANIAVLSALVGDQSENVTRTRAMAVVGAAYSVGFTLGPLVSVLCLKRLTDESVVSGLIFCSGDNRLWQWSFVWFGYLMIFSGLEFSLLFLTRTRFGYTGRDQGYMFFFMGVLMIIVQGGLVRRFQTGNETRLCSLAFFTLSLATVIIGISQHPYTFHLGLSLWAFAAATFVPTFNGMVSLITGPNRQGHIMGVFRSLNALARALGPAVFSLLFWTSGDSSCFLISAVFLSVLGVSFLCMNRSFSHT
ncbi:hypothetical protein AHF37_07016 [Paragonimus kellicotti]|nr:hypothetical protein AHF37_07016 [Paragonimus kellicotti]